MRVTTDLQTGRRFQWNTTYQVRNGNKFTSVPARSGPRGMVYLAPERVKPELLDALNDTQGPGKRNCGECLMADVLIVKLPADGKCVVCGTDYGPEAK